MSDYAVRIENVTKIYKLYDKQSDVLKEALNPFRKSLHTEFYALHDITFNIEKGQTIGIIGKNGSGKSTLLKIITGVLTQSAGEILVEGKISALLELGAGFNPNYTGVENIYLNGTMMGYTKEEMDERMKLIVDFADIGDFIHQPVKRYSSGMFARLAFAVAINVDPDILIVDEALSVGDVFFQNKCYKKFDEFKEAGKTILFVSHDLTSIIKYCDETVLLNEGRFIKKGDSNEVVNLFKKILVNQYNPDELSESSEETEQEETLIPETITENIWSDKLTLNPNVLKYGDNKVNIIDFAIIQNNKITNMVMKNEAFKILIKIQFHELIEQPIYAFTIKDRKGTEITGTNTNFESIPVLPGKPGEIKTITFTQKMRLQGGQYLLSLGCTSFHGDNLIIHDRLYDVCNIDVASKKDTIGFVDLNSVIEIK